MAGKRLTVRSRDIPWREGRYGKRRRSRPPRRPQKSRPVLDVVVALVASLAAGGLVLCMAFIQLGAHRLPLHLGYGALLGLVTLCSLLMGPRDRGGLMITGGLALVWSLGTLGLYVVRDQIHLDPRDARDPRPSHSAGNPARCVRHARPRRRLVRSRPGSTPRGRTRASRMRRRQAPLCRPNVRVEPSLRISTVV